MEGNVNEYFSSYEDLEIHQLMLDDLPRTSTYQKAILDNADYFKDKVIMDVGCGTGILSLFCAQAGARKVYAVEASNLTNLAREIVKENNYEEVIEVIHSRVEEMSLPENTKVDAIISEWMGFYLLHEGMLDSVIYARDKYLKEDGHMFPESAAIYVAPCSVPSLYSKWDDLYGVSMKSFGKHLRQSKCNKPEIGVVKSKDILAEEEAMAWIDLKENTVEELNSYSIQHVAVANKSGHYEGICVWFDCFFPQISEGSTKHILSTAPTSLPTHWKQTVITLPHSQNIEKGEPIAFQLDITRDAEYYRRYNLEVTLLDPETTEHPVPCSCDMTKCIVTKTFMMQHPVHSEMNGHAQPILVEDEISDDE